MKCLDTTFLIDIVEHPDETRGLAEDLEGRGDVLATTVFNTWEALLGAHSVRNPDHGQKLLDLYAKVLARLVLLPMTLDDASKAAELGGKLRRRGRDVVADALTAAIALRAGCDGIVTRNVSHFSDLAALTGLTVVKY